jgi:CRP-like cAMP-binding protein
MNEEKAKIAALLTREYPFQSLTPEQLLALAEKFSLRVLKEGEVLIGSKQVVEKFYLLHSGKLQAETTIHRPKKRMDILSPGDYFGDEILLTGDAPPITVKALEESTVIILEKEPFEQMLTDFPDVRAILNHTMQSRRMARSPRFSWLTPEESVFFITRKHLIFLIRGLIIPLLLIVVSIPLLTIGFAEYGVSSGINLALITGMIFLPLGIVAFWWKWLDWGNDYYIVTNQRVVWIEKILLLYDSRDETALYNVLAVDIYASWLGQILGYGDVSARTFTGRIPMRNTSHPAELASYIDGLRVRAEQIFHELEEKQMQDAIADALRRRRAPSPEDIIPTLPPRRSFKPSKNEKARKSGGAKSRWKNFIKIRYEQDGVITYRKWWPALIKKTWIPFLLLVLWLVGIAFLARQDNADGSTTIFVVFMIVILLGLIFWILYGFVDWRNDIYRLTPTQIFDIEKKPLGAEISKSADIENILTITHERSFIGVLLNYGNVVITVGETQFIFLSVYNPDRVHQDVANYQEALRQRKRKVQEARERERMINWLLAYDGESDKAE